MLIYGSSLKIKIVKNWTQKYADTAISIHFLPKHCLITLKKRILRSQMWPVELMHSKYRHKGRKKQAPTSRLFSFPTSWKGCSVAKKGCSGSRSRQ